MTVHTLDLSPVAVLDIVLNPSRDPLVGKMKPATIEARCGMIPHFFAVACLKAAAYEGSPFSLELVSLMMDDEYGFGGFNAFPIEGGTVSPHGVYAYPEDDPLPALARFAFDGKAYCWVFDYGIVALADNVSGPYMVARFD